jgi:hypothetical protein
MPDRNASMPACFEGNLRQSVRMASTMVTLNSSVISDMKVLICFISLSTLDSFPVLSRVVIANVAIERFVLEIRLSISGLHWRTASGLKEANWCKMRIAANLVTALGEVKNSCRTWMAWPTSASVRSGMAQIAFAASKLTISLLSLSQSSRSFIIGFLRPGSSSASLAASLTSMTRAAGDLTAPCALYCCTIFTSAILSCDRIWYNRPMAWYCVM